jgi:hypothetical protein
LQFRNGLACADAGDCREAPVTPPNSRARALAVGILLAMLLLHTAIAVAVGTGEGTSSVGGRADSSSVEPVFSSIEKAWAAGDARALVQTFGRRKVFISLPDGGPEGGLFSRDQSYYILKDLFGTARTEEFSFVTIHGPEAERSTAFGLAKRVFRPRDAGSALRDRVFVSLVLEGDRWVVSEIKSVR